MQHRLPESNLERFESEPRPATFNSVFPGGPPPPYLSSTEDATSFSECSTSTSNEKRRSSRSNLMTEDDRDNVNAYSRLPKKNFTNIDFTNHKQTSNLSYNPKAYGGYCPTNVSSSRTSSITGHSSASEFILMPVYAATKSGPPPDIHTEVKPKRDRMEELRNWWRKHRAKLFWTVLILFCIAAIVVPIVLSQTLKKRSKVFNWLPPLQYRLGQDTPSRVTMKVNSEQVRFNMSGDIPFKKGDYVTVYDFRSRKAILIDSSLKKDGKNLVCFVMNMNSTTVPNQEMLENAAKNSAKRKEQLQGWYEAWNYIPRPYSGNTAGILSSNISECDSARWIELSYTTYDQKGQKCTECYDFCLPEYGIENDSIRSESYLNVVRRVCFNLFVPEWRSFAYSNEQNQRDFESYYSNTNEVNSMITSRNTASQNRQDARNFETKWISLQQVPQRLTNLTQQAVDRFQTTLMGAAQSIFGSNPNSQSTSNTNNGNANSNGYSNQNAYPSTYTNSNANGQNGMGLTNEQAAWESGRPQGVLGVPQQQISQNGFLVQQGTVNQSLLPYQANSQGAINPEINKYQPYPLSYSSQPQTSYTNSGDGYNDSPTSYVPNTYNTQGQTNRYTGDTTRVRQVANTYGSNQYPQDAYRPVDINNPMNGVNGNSYSNQHNFGGGTNFPRQAVPNGQQTDQSHFIQSPSGYRPEIPGRTSVDSNSRINYNSDGSQSNSGQNWMTSR